MKPFLNKIREIFKKTWKKIFLILLSALLIVVVNFQLIQGKYSPTLMGLWFCSIFFFLFSQIEISFNKLSAWLKALPKLKTLLLIVLICSPALVRMVNYHPQRIHGDDLLTAYFSAHFNLSKDNFFGPIPSQIVDWVCQFPSVFFVLQKNFFVLFGESILTAKLSIIPYVLIISLLLYLITKNIFNEEAAIISLFLYSFFAVSLYHETIGLHFISSTALYLLFFYFLVIKRKGSFSLPVSGLFCGLCYLFYTSSYIALPIMVLFLISQLFIRSRKTILINLPLMLFGFLLVISPFLIYMQKNRNFYLTQRINQIRLINGNWTDTEARLKSGETTTSIIKENLLISVKSFYKDGLGGHGGYNFGHLALLEKSSLVFLTIGLLICLVLLFRKLEIFFVLVTTVVSFLTGMVLTLPPPAYHRFSIAFPFLIIIMSSPFYLLFSWKKLNLKLKFSLVLIFLIIYGVCNQEYFQKSVRDENDHTSLRLSRFIVQNFPGRPLYIASYPGFGFEKVFYFIERPLKRKVITGYHNSFLKDFNPNEKYVYAIIFPKDFNDKFRKLDPKGRIINFSQDYSLFVN